MWDAVNLFRVNKIPLFENDIKTWVHRWSYNSNLSLGSGQVNCRNILRKCKRKFQKNLNNLLLSLTLTIGRLWSSFKSMTLQTWQVFFLSSNVCQFKFFLSLRKLNLWCKLLQNYSTEEFLACIPTPSSPQYIFHGRAFLYNIYILVLFLLLRTTEIRKKT